MTTLRTTPAVNRYERHDAAPGATVQTMDGAKLGTVAETRGESFKVRTRIFHKDYWLETALISTADEATVVVGVLEQDVDQYRLLEAIDTDDALLDTGAQEEHRLRLERALAERK